MPEPSLRERRRTAAVREILDEAQREIAETGPSSLSLRKVARTLGMTVQALYHYFPSRATLITALITESYESLAEAVSTAPTFLTAAESFRDWSLTNPSKFQLLYGTPLHEYEAPDGGPTTTAATTIARAFITHLFGGYTATQLRKAAVPPLTRKARAALKALPPDSLGNLPPEATVLFVSAWGHLHGLITLEVFGHTTFLAEAQPEIFRVAMQSLESDLQNRIPPP